MGVFRGLAKVKAGPDCQVFASFNPFSGVSLRVFYGEISVQGGGCPEELVTWSLCWTDWGGALGRVESLLGQMVSF